MTADVRRRLERVPFVPFIIRTSDGHEYSVATVDHAKISPRGHRVVVFTDEVTRAANEIIALTRTPEFAKHATSSVPKGLAVPNESAHPNFHVVDFAICAEGDRLVPRLIELQAFPSLFGFQLLLLHCVRK